MGDLPPVDDAGKVSCQYITVVHFIWNFRCFRVILEGASSYYHNHFIDILIDRSVQH